MSTTTNKSMSAKNNNDNVDVDECPNNNKKTMSRERLAVENLLHSRIVCTLKDGRTAEGCLVCVDRLKNIILSDCTESRWIDSADYNPQHASGSSNSSNSIQRLVKRKLQQAMVPGSQLVSIHVSQDVYNQKVQPILLQE